MDTDEEINLNPDDYTYSDAIELFEIDEENDNIESVNIKYGTLRNIYKNNEDYLNLIDNLYLKILENQGDNDDDNDDDDDDDDDDEVGIDDSYYNNRDENGNANVQMQSQVNTNIESREALNFNNPENIKYAVNQITPNINHELLCIDSLYKKEGETSSSFEVNLPHPFHNVIEMKIASAEIPETEFFFSEIKRNNVFYLIIDYNRGNKQDTFDNNKEWIYVNTNNPTYAVIKIKIPDGIWYTGDLTIFINNLLDTAHGPFLNLMKFEITNYSGKTIFRFKTYDELSAEQKLLIKPADILIQNENEILSENNIYGPNAFFALSVGRTYIASNNNDKIYTNIIDINQELYNGFNLTEKEFENTSLFNMGFTLSQLYDDNLRIKLVDSNSKNLKSKEKEQVSISSINDIYLYYIESNYIYARNKQLYAYICIEDYVGNFMNHINVWGGNNNKITNKNIIARIQLGGAKFDTNITDSADNIFKKRQYFGPVTIKKLTVKLINSDGNDLDLNGSNISLTIDFSILYNSQSFYTFNSILKNKNNI